MTHTATEKKIKDENLGVCSQHRERMNNDKKYREAALTIDPLVPNERQPDLAPPAVQDDSNAQNPTPASGKTSAGSPKPKR